MIGVSCPGFSATPVAEWAGPISEHFRLWEIFSEADHIVYRDTPAIKGILDSALTFLLYKHLSPILKGKV